MLGSVEEERHVCGLFSQAVSAAVKPADDATCPKPSWAETCSCGAAVSSPRTGIYYSLRQRCTLDSGGVPEEVVMEGWPCLQLETTHARFNREPGCRQSGEGDGVQAQRYTGLRARRTGEICVF